MIPGHSALGGIEGALAEIRQAENDANRRLDEANRGNAEARAEEAERFNDLAAFRLKSESGLGGRLTQVATDVRAVLALRLNDRNRLDTELAAVEAEIDRIAAERQDFARKLGEAEERRDAVQNEAQVGLAAKGDYIAMKAEAEKAVHIAEESEKKARLAEESITFYGDNGLPQIASEVLEASKSAGPLPFEPPHIFRKRMRALHEYQTK